MKKRTVFQSGMSGVLESGSTPPASDITVSRPGPILESSGPLLRSVGQVSPLFVDAKPTWFLPLFRAH